MLPAAPVSVNILPSSILSLTLRFSFFSSELFGVCDPILPIPANAEMWICELLGVFANFRMSDEMKEMLEFTRTRPPGPRATGYGTCFVPAFILGFFFFELF